MAPFFALKYAPPAMGKTTPKQAYPNAAPKDQKYGSIIVVSSVASTYGGEWKTNPLGGREISRLLHNFRLCKITGVSLLISV
jgi:NAD(P)-dependent dehydrogenase (short-subunit alcohol dehydrogenase family)